MAKILGSSNLQDGVVNQGTNSIKEKERRETILYLTDPLGKTLTNKVEQDGLVFACQKQQRNH